MTMAEVATDSAVRANCSTTTTVMPSAANWTTWL